MSWRFSRQTERPQWKCLQKVQPMHLVYADSMRNAAQSIGIDIRIGALLPGGPVNGSNQVGDWNATARREEGEQRYAVLSRPQHRLYDGG
jgi:hypothetical protein